MRLLITGCGRSGTKWMADCLKHVGVECGHEVVWNENRYNRDMDWVAESSAYAAPYTEALKASEDDLHIVHLVRNPLHFIESAVWRGGVLKRSRYAARWIPELTRIRDKVKQAAYYWVKWNKLVHAHETVRIEDVDPELVHALADKVKYCIRPIDLPPPSNVSDRPRERRMVGWNQVENVPDIVRLATRCGYLPEERR